MATEYQHHHQIPVSLMPSGLLDVDDLIGHNMGHLLSEEPLAEEAVARKTVTSRLQTQNVAAQQWSPFGTMLDIHPLGDFLGTGQPRSTLPTSTSAPPGFGFPERPRAS